MDMRSLLLNYEIALCVYDADAIRQIQDWIPQLTSDCSARKLQTKTSSRATEGWEGFLRHCCEWLTGSVAA